MSTEILKLDIEIDWNRFEEMPRMSQRESIRDLVDRMFIWKSKKVDRQYTENKRPIPSKGNKKGHGYWNFRLLLLINDKLRDVTSKNDFKNMEFYEQLFIEYQRRMENNYGMFEPSVHGIKHKYRNTHPIKYSNKKKEE